MPKTIDIWRPTIQSTDQNGDGSGMVHASHLLAKIDRNEDGRVIGIARLEFATYAGLEAEWDAGTATTKLEAAIQTELVNVNFSLDQLSAAQKTIIDVQIAEA